jgi:cephalosporin-C deacetylase-like acetyl esterase
VEEVSINAAYNQERVSTLLYLPRNVRPPYQTVVWFPAGEAFDRGSTLGTNTQHRYFGFLVHAGRAVVLPAVKGSSDRHLGQKELTDVWGDVMVRGSQDIGRVIDYLETRPDFDTTKLAYAGQSLGAGVGPIMTAMEPRFKASVLIAGGLHEHQAPLHADALNFAPRVRVPTLMITGKHDFYFPYETSQKPLLELLGVPRHLKKHKLFESGHFPREIGDLQRETTDWLDRHIGAIRR